MFASVSERAAERGVWDVVLPEFDLTLSDLGVAKIWAYVGEASAEAGVSTAIASSSAPARYADVGVFRGVLPM